MGETKPVSNGTVTGTGIVGLSREGSVIEIIEKVGAPGTN
jgi:hypothetical protein